jgi:cytochrome c556
MVHDGNGSRCPSIWQPPADFQAFAETHGLDAEQVQDAIDQGAPLDVIQRHFHLSESELRDYCADLMVDGLDDPGRSSVSGY